MKVNTKISIINWFIRLKLPIITIVTLLLIYLLIVRLLPTLHVQFSSINNILNNSSVIGLLGVLIGSVLSLVGTFLLNSHQVKIKGIITRKNVIYSPLYDELTKFYSELRKINYPQKIITRQIDLELLRYQETVPCFTAWNRIMSDVRGIEVPLHIKKYFNKLISKSKNYMFCIDQAYIEIEAKLKNVLLHEEKNQFFEERLERNRNSIQQRIMTDILLNDSTFDSSLSSIFFLGDEDLKNQMMREIKQILIESKSLASVLRIKKEYEDLKEYTADLTLGIAKVINFIQIRYENKSRLI
ncbi:hypothetical protein [Bacillus haynesii]|uniref:hypothetical protein n=1 Tax=Bacillus haynesii TaxID=1925021 RepID=UPI00227EB538|nr:hypothetical protein [Bacillus haynesii]MCY9263999.1 hypothetical protein [Bacillus haynesii]MEC1531469.1 hypothetical protein [Bacillus haynesii]